MAGSLAVVAAILLTRPGVFWDLDLYHRAFVAYWHHEPPYSTSRYIDCIPSTLLLLSPLGALDDVTGRIVVRVFGVAFLLVAVWTSLGVVWERRPPVRWVVAGSAALILFEPARTILRQGNIGVFAVAFISSALWCAVSGRWKTFAVLLGLGLAIKPVAIALLLLPLLHRRWAAAALAVAVPVALNGIALALTVHPGEFFSLTLPHLLHGYPERWYSHGSLRGVLESFGTPGPIVLLARVGAGIGMLWAAVRRHRFGGPEGLRIAETAGCLVLATLLATTTTLNHYLLFVLPMLLGLSRPGSVMRNPLAAAGLVLVFAPFRWSFTPLHDHIHQVTLVWAFGMFLIAIALVWRACRSSTEPIRLASAMGPAERQPMAV